MTIKHTFISNATVCSELNLHLQLQYICVLYGALLQHAVSMLVSYVKTIGKVHPCTGTEALYMPYGL